MLAESETVVVQVQAKECQGLRGATRSSERNIRPVSFSETPEGANCTNTLISDSGLLNCERIDLVLSHPVCGNF